MKTYNLLFGVFVLTSSAISFAAVHFDSNEVRAWNKNEKDQFPTPLAAVFKKGNTTLAFVGDHHIDPAATYKLVESAINKINPQIIVVEGLPFGLGENPKKDLSLYKGKTKEDVWKDPSLGCGTQLLAVARNIPIVGGEPTLEEQMSSKFLTSKGYTSEDIRNVQILQRIPYRRDKLKMSRPDQFFKYAKKLYQVKEPKESFKTGFKTWYKNKTQKDFDYNKITKDESAVNCGLNDTFLQKIACDFNINRDRFLVERVESLFENHHRVLVVYGAGHFVQEYPAYVKGFGATPYYIK